MAREAARERPDLVHRVITLGTPVVGGPKYTVVARRFHRRGMDMAAIEAEIELRNQISLRTPVTAIYSRADAVVAWEACIDHNGTDVEHIEVRTTHIGLGFSAEVYKIIAQRLADDGKPSCHAAGRCNCAASWPPTLAVNSSASPYPQTTRWNGTLYIGFLPYSLSPSV